MRTIILSIVVVVGIVMTSFTYKKSLVVTSSAFANNGMIPPKYTCLGQEASPPLQVANMPAGTRSLVLIVDDPDAPVTIVTPPPSNVVTYNVSKTHKKHSTKKTLTKVTTPAAETQGCFTHWIMWNIELNGAIPENFRSDYEGMNGVQQVGYKGMCPQKGLHHYHFKVYALDTKLNLSRSSDKATLEKVMEGHILAWGDLVGTFDKNYR